MQFDIAARRAEQSPDHPAVWFRARWHTYAELNARAERLARRLHTLGIAPGDRVGILAANHIAHVDLLLAAPKLGHIATPFNFRLLPAEQKGLGEYIAPKLMLCDAKNRTAADAAGAPVQALEDYEDWLNGAPHVELPAHQPDAEDVAMILFTGGSTGLPKGAMIPYRQLLANCVHTCQAWGITADDCVIQATPAFHAAFNVFSTPLLYAGGRVVMQETFDPGEYLQLAQRERATLLFMVPTMFQMLAEHPDFETVDLSSVRWAIAGGAPCPEPLRARFAARGIHFKLGYGMTEAGVNCFTISVQEAQRRPGSVGLPMPGTEAAIRDEHGQPVPRGTVGELTLRGPHVFPGYYRRPEETEKCIRDGWLWTGDLARQDEDGFFHIVGRSKEMYISGGENVYPPEVEAALYEQPEVAECAVLGVPHERWGETGLAAVTLKAGRTLTGEELRARLKQRLAGFKVPTQYLFYDTLPRSGAGKILKPEIRRRYEQEHA